MSVFKNEVGRTSNETLKKRKYIVGGGIALAVVFVFTLVVVGTNVLSSSSSSLTTSIANSSSSRLVISSRKVKSSGLFRKNRTEYYIDASKVQNIDLESQANRGNIKWVQVGIFGTERLVGSTWLTTFTPAVFLNRYYCFTWDVNGNKVVSNSILYLG